MNGRSTSLFAFGSIFFGAACIALGVSACSGDDTVFPVADASAHDGSNVDGTVGGDSGNDSSAKDGGSDGDAAACIGSDAALDDAAVAAGMALVLQYKCYACHQTQSIDAGLFLSGHNTSISDAGLVYPPNLTPDKATGLGCWTDSQIQNAILNAIDDQGQSLCVMPKFATRGMDGGSAAQIVEFLRSLNVVSNQVPNTTCPPPQDAGPDANDAGPDANDAGPDANDAGPDANDAGPDANDAGPDANDAAGD
jgi:hypothetical protein